MDEHTKIKNNNNETVKAGCVIINENKEVLLIIDLGMKSWTLPKGHVESNESFEQTAMREMREETGYEVEILKRLSDITYTHGQSGEQVRVVMFKAKPIKKGIATEKNIESKWFSVDEARRVVRNNFVDLLDEI